jgi:hypothetical protein
MDQPNAWLGRVNVLLTWAKAQVRKDAERAEQRSDEQRRVFARGVWRRKREWTYPGFVES